MASNPASKTSKRNVVKSGAVKSRAAQKVGSASVRANRNPVEISILVPVMNEAGNIRPLIDEICSAFAGRQFEIIYIDDASNDATANELTAALDTVPQLRVLRHTQRAGQSAAIRSGLLQANGNLIGVLDGDGQNVPADFPALESSVIAASKNGKMVMAAGIRQRRDDSACVYWHRVGQNGCAQAFLLIHIQIRVVASRSCHAHCFCNCPFSIICTGLCQVWFAAMAGWFLVCRWRIARALQAHRNIVFLTGCLLAFPMFWG